MNFFKGFSRIKYYIMAMLAFFGLYVRNSVSGIRLTGDDNETKEERAGHSGHGTFYHK